MNSRIWDSVGAMTGIAFVVLLCVSAVLVGNVDDDLSASSPSSEIASALAEQADRVEIGSFIALLGVLSFLGFLAYFRSRLQRAEGDGGWLTYMAYGGGLVTAVMFLMFVSFNFATTSISEHDLDTQVAKTFFVYKWNYVWVLAPPMIAFTLGASLAIVRYAVLPRWTGWIGFVVALSLLMPWIGGVVTLGWIAMISVVMLVQVWRTPQPAQQARPAPETAPA